MANKNFDDYLNNLEVKYDRDGSKLTKNDQEQL